MMPVEEALRLNPEFELERLQEMDPAVTVRLLLPYTTGYREIQGTLSLAGQVPRRDSLPREIAFDVVHRQPALEFRPGSVFRCKSTAFVVLAEVLRRAPGEPPAALTKDHVLDPLGME